MRCPALQHQAPKQEHNPYHQGLNGAFDQGKTTDVQHAKPYSIHFCLSYTKTPSLQSISSCVGERGKYVFTASWIRDEVDD